MDWSHNLRLVLRVEGLRISRTRCWARPRCEACGRSAAGQQQPVVLDRPVIRSAPLSDADRLALRRLSHQLHELVKSWRAPEHEVACSACGGDTCGVEAALGVNAHFIANAAMITASIARWNLALELLPLTSENDGR